MLAGSQDDGSLEDKKTVFDIVVGVDTDGSGEGSRFVNVVDVDGHFLFWTWILSSLQSGSNCNIK